MCIYKAKHSAGSHMKQTDGKYLSKRNNQRQGKFYNKDANSIHKLNFQNKPNESPKKRKGKRGEKGC